MAKQQDEIHPDYFEQLTSLERELVKSQLLVTVRGKRGSPVPILMPHDCQLALDYLANPSIRQTLEIKKHFERGCDILFHLKECINRDRLPWPGFDPSFSGHNDRRAITSEWTRLRLKPLSHRGWPIETGIMLLISSTGTHIAYTYHWGEGDRVLRSTRSQTQARKQWWIYKSYHCIFTASN